jgi:enamine deaminase RidA (YjgF/YER057c/UK114 family)
VRVGNRIYVTGTTALGDDGEIVGVGVGDAYEQAKQCLRNIETALKRLGAGFEHIVRTRMYVTDISRWEEYGRAHGELLGDVMPATAMVEVSRLIDPRMLIEIEADAEL